MLGEGPLIPFQGSDQTPHPLIGIRGWGALVVCSVAAGGAAQ